MFRFCFHTTRQCTFSELRSFWILGRTWSIRHQAQTKQLIFLKAPIKWMAWITLKVFRALHWQAYPFFTRPEMGKHIARSGKNIGNKGHHYVPTPLRKAKTFLEDEYLREIIATRDDKCFYFKAKCCHSYRKKNNNPLHQLKLSTCILRSCTVAEKVGSCNHISALMLKVSKCSLYKAKTKILLKEEN